MSGMSASGLESCGGLSSSTMMVMMIAITPSLNASIRPVVMDYFLRPIAKRLAADRTYITPSDKAGVAINNSPIEFVAM